VEWLITNAVAAWLLPPGFVVAALFAGWLLMRKRPALARGVVGLALIALYALATPFVAHQLRHRLEAAPSEPVANKTGQAIVVLGAGIQMNAPEYGADSPSTDALSRLRYGAHLYRALGKPVLVTGGAVLDYRPEAIAMKAVLENEFRVPVRWIERKSRNTLENARLSRELLDAEGIRKIYLVTQAWHMPRARLAFEHAGFEVIPAATGYSRSTKLTILDFAPSADALLTSSRSFHEVIGIGWYHLRFLLGR
jgi:uncharacterized SAM-binding protein YcdF (DUF218 family)